MAVETTLLPPDAAFASTRPRRLAELAVAQHGAVQRRQLAELGYTRHRIEGMVRALWLHRVHHGVYAVGRRSLGPKGRWMAAVLACGPGGMLSHRSAAALRGVRRTSQAVVEVTVPTERGAHAGVRTYLSRCIEPPDRTIVDGIPCASLALTLLQLSAVTDRRQTERAIDEAEVQRLLDRREIDELLERSRGRRGAATLRAVLAAHDAGSTLTRSALEELALAVIREAGLPLPHVNAPVACGPGSWHTVDFHWPAERVVLETDGHRFHRTAAAVERDRRRDADLAIAGQRVLRSTWRQLEREPGRVVRMLRVALGS